jgi:carboxyl-terminal processing protease
MDSDQKKQEKIGKSFFSSRPGIITLAVVCMAAVFFFGVILGYQNRPEVDKITSLVNKQSEMPGDVDFSLFWKAWNVINDKYVLAKDVKSQDKVYGAIQGLAQSLGDPYTVFMPPVEAKSFNTQISGNFDGVGMEVGMKNGVLTVISPLKGNPAEKAGVMKGDVILKIEATSTQNMTVDEAVNFIRGPKGTSVNLTLYRNEKQGPFVVKLIRDTINIPTVDTELRKDGIFVIRLYSFDALSDDLFRQALQKLIDSNSNKLIFDLRGNPGGYLDAAVDMASFFLPEGKVVVREDYGGKKSEDVLTSKGYNVFNKKIRMVILVDGGSASASEILSGALSENGVAKLVGEQTFGKGSVQEVVNLTPDTNLKVTIARWLTPNGISISQKGITPDYIVKMTQADVDKGLDPQLDKAVQLLTN